MLLLVLLISYSQSRMAFWFCRLPSEMFIVNLDSLYKLFVCNIKWNRILQESIKENGKSSFSIKAGARGRKMKNMARNDRESTANWDIQFIWGLLEGGRMAGFRAACQQFYVTPLAVPTFSRLMIVTLQQNGREVNF